MSELERLRTGLDGRYAVDRSIGSGGMARVYLAHDLRHDRPVAIKVLRQELAAAVGPDRFQREIHIAAGLQHPHILPVYDSGEADGLLYYVMPYVPEQSLRDRLNIERRLPLSDAIQIASEIAAALDYAHAANLIHRDIKPENILLRSGTATITDFGIARAIEEAADLRLTEPGWGIGTPLYASPEQMLGEPVLDRRCDVYSLASLTYEMIVGAPPFAGATPLALLARKTAELPPRMVITGVAVQPGIEAAILRALDRNPEKRFATAGEFARELQGAGQSAPTPADSRPRALAVLPFENLSRNPADEYLSDGLTEELIHALGKIDHLRVIARTSSFAFRGSRESIRTIAQSLNVDTVLEGSLQRSGNRLRVTVRLIEARTDLDRWSERYDRTMDDVFALQDEIAASVVRIVTGEQRSANAAGPTEDPAAYEMYLKGRHYWNARTEAGLRRSIECLTAAVERDPRFGLAYAGLADACVTLALYGATGAGEAIPQALDAAEKALALGGAEPEALTARACARAIYEWRWLDAAADFERAIALKPQYAPAYQWYAINCLAPRGRLAEASARLATAQALDPLSPAVGLSRGLVHHFDGQDDLAIREYDRLLELDPRYPMAHYFRGQALLETGQTEVAVEALTRAAELAGESPETVAALGHALGRAGERDRAEAIRRQLVTRGAERYVSPVLLALVDVGLGDLDGAFRELERALSVRAVELIWLPVRPAFRHLRADPRFGAVAEALRGLR